MSTVRTASNVSLLHTQRRTGFLPQRRRVKLAEQAETRTIREMGGSPRCPSASVSSTTSKFKIEILVLYDEWI